MDKRDYVGQIPGWRDEMGRQMKACYNCGNVGPWPDYSCSRSDCQKSMVVGLARENSILRAGLRTLAGLRNS